MQKTGLIGHSAILNLLSLWVKKPAHGYLFIGPSRLGKRTVAEHFIKALLGLTDNQSLSAHPDLITLDPEEGKTIVSIKIVREARANFAGRPLVADRRVMFIPRLDRLNEEGMNALLKTMEEPPVGAVFVCVAEDGARIPATIHSRLVKVPFSPVPKSEIVSGLIARGIEKEEAERRAFNSRGRPGRAIENLDSTDVSAERFLSATTVGERFAIIEGVVKDCESAENSADAWGLRLDAWAETFRLALPKSAQTAIVAGQGVLTAKRFAGGALSPRLPLEAVALRLASKNPLADFFPSFLPKPFPSIFE